MTKRYIGVDHVQAMLVAKLDISQNTYCACITFAPLCSQLEARVNNNS